METITQKAERLKKERDVHYYARRVYVKLCAAMEEAYVDDLAEYAKYILPHDSDTFYLNFLLEYELEKDQPPKPKTPLTWGSKG